MGLHWFALWNALSILVRPIFFVVNSKLIGQGGGVVLSGCATAKTSPGAITRFLISSIARCGPIPSSRGIGVRLRPRPKLAKMGLRFDTAALCVRL